MRVPCYSSTMFPNHSNVSCRVEVKHFTVKEAKAGAGVGSAGAAASALRAASADGNRSMSSIYLD
jgi:hypothetical protein